MGIRRVLKKSMEFYKYKLLRYPALKYIAVIVILLLTFLFFLGWNLYGPIMSIFALGAMAAILLVVQMETYHHLNGIFRERARIEEALAMAIKPPGLLNRTYMNNIIINNDRYAWSHGAENNFLGTGILYYGFVHLLRARIAVCFGSGGGFVPRAIRQAQRDLGMNSSSRTILVDADLPEVGWGNPDYLQTGSFLKTEFPDIEIRVKKTVDAVKQFELENIKIDYLHIDANKTYEDTLTDFKICLPLMSEHFIITIHDTEVEGVKKALEEIRKMNDIEVIDFNCFPWSGLAVIKKKKI